jgi:hypothetical protein
VELFEAIRRDARREELSVRALAERHGLTRSVLGLSATAYYQRLLALLDRLRAERDHRRRARVGT